MPNYKRLKPTLPNIPHIPMPNILPAYSVNGKTLPASEYIEFPSVKMEFDAFVYMDVVNLLSETLHVKCVFFDGEVVIIPEYYADLIDWLISNYSGKVIQSGYGKCSEFVTLAIKSGLKGHIVALGHSISGLDGTPQEMLANAVHHHDVTILRWISLYESSMTEH